MPYGYTGNILRVNLTDKTFKIENYNEQFYRSYFGGRGFISYFLLKELKPGVEPLSSENKLIFAAGILTGGSFAGSGRHSIGAKSPLTNGYGESEAGGYWGTELKKAGFDGIIVEGKAHHPTYIWIHDGKVEIRDASHLWGKSTGEVQKQIIKELDEPKVRIAQIGPAGERMVRFACITHDLKHFAGRAGLGAVMGSKNLRAVVVRGSGSIEPADPVSIKKLSRWMNENFKKYSGPLHELGTGNLILPLNEIGGLPTRNFKESSFEGAANISAERMKEEIQAGTGTCYACPIRCKREVEVGVPYNVTTEYGGPEYETLAALGSNCGIDDLKAVAKGNQLCNEWGLDTISTGSCISFAMECFENGLLSEKDTGGLQLNFGNASTMMELIPKIARREEFGKLLSEGVMRAAQVIGKESEQYAMHIKGQELPMHEPRLKQGMGLGYAVSPTGADHCHNIHDTIYVKENPRLEYLKSIGHMEPLPVDDLSLKKVKMLIYDFFRSTLINSAGLCYFLAWGPEHQAELVRGMTGWNSTTMELFKVIERGVTMARCFNLREGFGASDDYLNERFFTPLLEGPLKGVSVSKEKFDRALKGYYRMLGWNDAGEPTIDKLNELGIEWVAEVVKLNE